MGFCLTPNQRPPIDLAQINDDNNKQKNYRKFQNRSLRKKNYSNSFLQLGLIMFLQHSGANCDDSQVCKAA